MDETPYFQEDIDYEVFTKKPKRFGFLSNGNLLRELDERPHLETILSVSESDSIPDQTTGEAHYPDLESPFVNLPSLPLSEETRYCEEDLEESVDDPSKRDVRSIDTNSSFKSNESNSCGNLYTPIDCLETKRGSY